MCGLVGIIANQPVNQEIYDALTVLQHRGQDSSGIMTDDNGVLCLRKSNGKTFFQLLKVLLWCSLGRIFLSYLKLLFSGTQ